MVEVTEEIKDQNVIPLTGYFYGPLEVEEQSFAIKISKLICEADLDVENNSTIESQIYNLHQKQNIIVQSVNERLNNLEVNIKLLFIRE